ncbi:hypothetical protein Tco_0065052 [Tanacetum coccineum]
MTVPFPSHLDNHYYEEEKENYGPKFTKAYGASHINDTRPRKEKDLGSFTLPCFINNTCFDNAIVDLGASISGRIKEDDVLSGSEDRTLSREMMNSVPAIFEVWEMARKISLQDLMSLKASHPMVGLSSQHIPTLRLSDRLLTPNKDSIGTHGPFGLKLLVTQGAIWKRLWAMVTVRPTGFYLREHLQSKKSKSSHRHDHEEVYALISMSQESSLRSITDMSLRHYAPELRSSSLSYSRLVYRYTLDS